MALSIEPTQEKHLADIWRIEQLAHTHPWQKSMIDDLNSRCACHHVMLFDEQVVGYYYAQNVVGEVTLLNIAIDPTQQGKGYGKTLLEALIENAEENEAESIWLEVRASNTKAHSLYLSQGFNEVDRRKNYYPSEGGREDAIVMSCTLKLC